MERTMSFHFKARVVLLKRPFILALGLVFPSYSVVFVSALAPLHIYFDSSHHLHRDMAFHAEQPARITACLQALDPLCQQEQDLILVDVSLQETPQAVVSLVPSTVDQPLTEQELQDARDVLLLIHEPELVTQLEARCLSSRQRRIDEGKPPLGYIGYLDAGDTFVTTETFCVCLRATATWMRATRWAMTSSSAAMALTRPPGHHATRALSNGFCLFNFCAAAAVDVLQRNASHRVSILDWDVHYGQGVADIIGGQARARYASVHQTPAFPYMGEQHGIQGAHNNVLTVPITAGTTWDTGFAQAFDQALQFLCNEDWDPDVVIVCAGYDALDSDELASVCLQAADYRRMVDRLWDHLQATAKKKPAIVLGLEGGYQINDMPGGNNLQGAVLETIDGLLRKAQSLSTTKL